MLKLLKFILLLFLVTFLLLIVFFISLNSRFIATNYFIPAINETLDIKLSAKSFNLSLFKEEITIEEFNCFFPNSDFYVNNCKKLKIKFELLDLIKGNLKVKELEVDSLALNTVLSKVPSLKEFVLEAKTSKINFWRKRILSHLHLKNVKLNNASININLDNASSISIENLNLYIPFVEPGRESSVTADYQFNFEIQDKLESSSDISRAEVRVKFNRNLIPENLSVDSQINKIAYTLFGKQVLLNKVVTSTQLKYLNGSLYINNLKLKEYGYLSKNKISDLTIRGFIKPITSEVNVNADIAKLSSNLTNIATGYYLDLFSDNSELSCKLLYSRKNELHSSKGVIRINNLNLSHHVYENSEASSDPINLVLSYDADANYSREVFNIKKLNLASKLGNRDVSTIRLLESIKLKKSNNKLIVANPGSKFSINIDKLELGIFSKNWINFLSLPIKKISGSFSAKGKLEFTEGNKALFTSEGKVENLFLFTEYLKFSDLDILSKTSLHLTNLDQIILDKFDLNVSNKTKLLLEGKVSANYSRTDQKGDISLELRDISQHALNLFNLPEKVSTTLANLSNDLKEYRISLSNNILFNFNEKPFLIDKLIFKLKHKNKLAAQLELTEQCKIIFDNYTPVLYNNEPFKTQLQLNNIDGLLINYLITNERIKLLSGKINGKVTGLIKEEGKKIEMSGSCSLKNGRLTYNNLNLKQIDLELPLEIQLKNYESFILKSRNVSLNIKDIIKSTFNLDGHLGSMDDGKLKLSDIKLKYNSNTYSTYNSIKTLTLSGNAEVVDYRLKNELKVLTDLSIDKLKLFNDTLNANDTSSYNGVLNSEFKLSKFLLEFIRLNINLFNSKKLLGKISANGRIYLPLIFNKSNLNISLEGFDLTALVKKLSKINIFSYIQKIQGLDLLCTITGKNLTLFKEKILDTNIKINKNSENISINPITISLDQGNISGRLNLSSGLYIKDKMSGLLNLKGLKLQPIYNLLSSSSRNISGMINKAQVTFDADSPIESVPIRKVKTQIYGSLTNLSSSGKKNHDLLTDMALMPFKNLTKPQTDFFENTNPAFYRYIKNILSGHRDLAFETVLFSIYDENDILEFYNAYAVNSNSTICTFYIIGGIDKKQIVLTYLIGTNNNKFYMLCCYGDKNSPNTKILSIPVIFWKIFKTHFKLRA